MNQPRIPKPASSADEAANQEYAGREPDEVEWALSFDPWYDPEEADESNEL